MDKKEYIDKNLLFDLIYPIGSIYISVSSINPSTIFNGVWEPIQDKFLLGASSTYTAGSTGGEAMHTLTINEMPSHSHQIGKTNDSGKYASDVSQSAVILFDNMGGEIPSEEVGNSQPHNNMPPYLAVYIWKRMS